MKIALHLFVQYPDHEERKVRVMTAESGGELIAYQMLFATYEKEFKKLGFATRIYQEIVLTSDANEDTIKT